ncbi:uncharacterized protein NPIL_407531 [Nephila pilipes]|uniref:Uncharacterized protein n=1 Tax=Nephila pilipes TaxID=299642 RepID=A0A8X6PF30_NEPPI|nr:uncharacterized protein NPIL_407531 [Nephila pilipes]
MESSTASALVSLQKPVIDSGSQSTYVSEKIMTQLNAFLLRTETVIHALFGGDETKPKSQSICNREETEINLLIGADVIGNIVILECDLTAVKMKLGWTVFGKGLCRIENILPTPSVHSMPLPANKVWELQVIGKSSKTEKEKNEFTLKDFNDKIKILPDERYDCKHTSKNSGDTSVMGIIWNLDEDTLKCKIDFEILSWGTKINKRLILSTVQNLYDPIGVLTLTALLLKLIVQSLWKSYFSWDEELPPSVVIRFSKWLNEMYLLKDVTLPLLMNFNKTSGLHAFVDAYNEGILRVKAKISNRDDEICLLNSILLPDKMPTCKSISAYKKRDRKIQATKFSIRARTHRSCGISTSIRGFLLLPHLSGSVLQMARSISTGRDFSRGRGQGLRH